MGDWHYGDSVFLYAFDLIERSWMIFVANLSVRKATLASSVAAQLQAFARPRAESSDIYSRSTPRNNFEIGSSQIYESPNEGNLGYKFGRAGWPCLRCLIGKELQKLAGAGQAYDLCQLPLHR